MGIRFIKGTNVINPIHREEKEPQPQAKELRIAGEVIKELREKEGWSQSELGSRVGINGRTIRKLETCNYSTQMDTLEKIFDQFGYKMEFYISKEDFNQQILLVKKNV